MKPRPQLDVTAVQFGAVLMCFLGVGYANGQTTDIGHRLTQRGVNSILDLLTYISFWMPNKLMIFPNADISFRLR